jgi:hypothetical protein
VVKVLASCVGLSEHRIVVVNENRAN